MSPMYGLFDITPEYNTNRIKDVTKYYLTNHISKYCEYVGISQVETFIKEIQK